jgi:hypothetical protein
MTATATRFVALMEPVARELLGEPNEPLSSKNELRYGSRGSMSVNLEKGTWFDNESKVGGGLLDLITRETGRKDKARLDWLNEHGYGPSYKPNGAATRSKRPARAPLGKIVATFSYPDEAGVLLFQVTKHDPKDFRQRKPDGNGGWIWKLDKIRRVPYRLVELNEDIAQERTIFIVEGEKDVNNLRNLGAPATCNPGGAGNWGAAKIDQHFEGVDAVIIPDNDPQSCHEKTGEPMVHPDGRPVLPGQDHAQDVAQHLHGVAARVRVLDLKGAWPDCPPKGDISSSPAPSSTPAPQQGRCGKSWRKPSHDYSHHLFANHVRWPTKSSRGSIVS